MDADCERLSPSFGYAVVALVGVVGPRPLPLAMRRMHALCMGGLSGGCGWMER